MRCLRLASLGPASLAVVALLAGVARAPAAYAADRPAAMVEAVSGPIAGVQAMDYLADGTVVELGTAGMLVVDYLASCVRETITGGTARIGAAQSSVEHGTISRRRVECDGAELQLTATQSDQGGVAVYRSALAPLPLGGTGLPQPDLTLRGRAPFVTTKQAGTIKIERLDADEPAREVTAAGSGRIGVEITPLAAGGLYRATLGTRSLVFRIAPDAGMEVPLVARLLPL